MQSNLQKSPAFGLFSVYLFIGRVIGVLVVNSAFPGHQLVAILKWIIVPMTAHIASLSWPTDPFSANYSNSQSAYNGLGALTQSDAFMSSALSGWSSSRSGSKSGAAVDAMVSIDHRSPEGQPWLFDSFDIGTDRTSLEPTELVVIDRGVEGWEILVEDLRGMQRGGRQLEVVVLDEARDGVVQISDLLAGYRNLTALHIVSHGQAGGLQLGNAGLFDGNLSLYATELVGWRDSLAEGADILIYGCDVAAGKRGQSFVDGLAALTGADVAASSDMTGAGSLGGNWGLEFQTGVIDSRLAFSATLQSKWQYLLDVNIDQAWLSARGPGPYYLDQPDETYILQTDVTTAGTAFVIIAQNVTFDLNGHTITYDNTVRPVIANHSFEAGNNASATSWDFTNAPAAHRFAGTYIGNQVYDGDHSLRFANWTGEQTVQHQEVITLQPQTSYSLSAMFRRQNWDSMTSAYVRLEGISSVASHQVTFTSSSFARGIQLVESTFTTGTEAGQYRLVIGATNGTSAANALLFVDDIRIQTSRHYGVLLSPSQNLPEYYPGVNRYGVANGGTVMNGKIRQGVGASSEGFAVFMRTADNVSLNSLELTTHGINASPVSGQYADNAQIFDNVIYNNVKTISKRDSFDGATIYSVQGTFYNNSLIGGPHTAIITPSGSINHIYNNLIRMRSRYTNGFAIFLKGDAGSNVHDNIIDQSDGEFSGRGIGISHSSALLPTRIYRNTVSVQELSLNQEYGGGVVGGAYGIQIEGRSNVEVYENTITVIGREVGGFAIRHNGGTSNHFFHDNVIRALDFGQKVSALYLTELNGDSQFRFENNLVSTNSQWIGEASRLTDLVLGHNTFKVEGDLTRFRGFEVFQPESNPESWRIQGFTFLNNLYADNLSRSYFENMSVRNSVYGTPLSGFDIDYSTTIRVKDSSGLPISDANVVVRNRLGEVVFEGQTNADGKLVGVVTQLTTIGSATTLFDDHSFEVSLNGQSASGVFVSDAEKTIDVTLGSSQPPHRLEYVGTKLLAYGNEQDNQFEWSALDPYRLHIDGYTYNIRNTTTEMDFLGMAGNDTLAITGSAGDDLFTILPGDAALTADSGIRVSASSFELVNVSGGGGDFDRAVLVDSAGSDSFTAAPGVASLEGTGFRHSVSGFHRVIANSTAGNDIAQFQDSAGDDSFLVKPGFASMISGPFTNRANGFSRITANATAGGNDLAGLTGSAEVNVFSAYPTWATLTRMGYEARVNGFESVYGYSGGSSNVAWLHDSADKDTLAGNILAPRLFGTGFSNLAIGFTRVYSAATAGNDKLNLGDSPADDVFTITPGLATLVGGGILVQATGFVSQIVRSDQGGVDTVYLRASGSWNSVNMFDTFTGMSNSQASWFQRASAFANTHVEITSPGQDNQIYVTAPPAGNVQNMEFLLGWGWSRHADRLRRFSGFNRATVQYRQGIDSYTRGDINYALTMVMV